MGYHCNVSYYQNMPVCIDIVDNETRLATANRSRVSICVTKNFGQGRGRGRPCKNFANIQFDHHAKFGSVANAVCAHGPKNLGGHWRPHHLIWGSG